METSLEVSRQILYGISRYAKKHGPWILEYISGGISAQMLPEGWDGDVLDSGSRESLCHIASMSGSSMLRFFALKLIPIRVTGRLSAL